MTLYIPVGPPGCGKSTLGKKLVRAGIITSDAIVSSDATRKLITGDPTNQDCTQKAFDIVNIITYWRLQHDMDVYLDATNVQRKQRNYYIEKAEGWNQPVTVIYTELSEDAINARNNSEYRQNAGVVVPEEAMGRMFDRYRIFDITESTWPTYVNMEELHEYLDDLLFEEYHGVNEYDED